MGFVIRAASAEDASSLSRFAAEVFRETFAEQNQPEDIERYLADAFTAEQQAQEISDPHGVVLLAEIADGAAAPDLIGYAHIVSGAAPPAVAGPAPFELRRLYVAPGWHGRGVARALMDEAIRAARMRGARTLWLGVWERNPRAINFYLKYGFTRVGDQTFVLGDDHQTDWVLTLSLPGEHPGSSAR
jgi:ribosomal protein S18 acetylase RimI-like enzyme